MKPVPYWEFESLNPGETSSFHGTSSSEYMQKLNLARQNKNRYFLLASNLGYSQYLQFRNFPLLTLGAFKGGLIVEQSTKRDYPMGVIAQRLIGYERFDDLALEWL